VCPHGACFTRNSDIFVAECVEVGRVTKRSRLTPHIQGFSVPETWHPSLPATGVAGIFWNLPNDEACKSARNVRQYTKKVPQYYLAYERPSGTPSRFSKTPKVGR
jgi:hypothetical protein